jgi:hypothetical protein
MPLRDPFTNSGHPISGLLHSFQSDPSYFGVKAMPVRCSALDDLSMSLDELYTFWTTRDVRVKMLALLWFSTASAIVLPGERPSARPVR